MTICAARRLFLSQMPIASLLLVATVAGCGGGGGGKADASKKPTVAAAGKVEFEGSPLENGTITIISADTGNSVSAPIKGGAYSFSAASGPNVGKAAVLITGKDSADGPATWTYSSQTDVPAGGLTGADFKVAKKDTKAAPKANPDD